MQQGGIVGLIIAVILIIGVAMGIVWNVGNEQQTVQSVSLEEFTTTDTSPVQLANTRIVTGSDVVINATDAAVKVRGTEYTINYNLGQVAVSNGTGDWNISYNYKPTAYIDNSMGRLVVGFIIVFVAIVGLVIVSKSISN